MGQHREDLSGMAFNRLRVLRFHENRNRRNYWWCLCSCGREVSIRVNSLKSGITQSCGCYKDEINHQKFEDLSGRCFGRLTVIGRTSDGKWSCCCSCGNTIEVKASSIKSGHTNSCGCLQREAAKKQAETMGRANKSHGKTSSREYETWHRMKQRCYDPKSKNYLAYGGRGITICDRWTNSFENFLADMGTKPSDKHSLDRVNNNGNYEPGNCRWATQKEQQRNRRSNILVTYKGQIKCIAEWAEEYGVPMIRLWWRLRKRKWPIHKALTTPSRRSQGE